MYNVYATINGPKTNTPLLNSSDQITGAPVPAVILNNFGDFMTAGVTGGVTMEMRGCYGVSFDYMLPAYTSELLEVCCTHINNIPAGTSVTILTQ
tara:strand:- start:6443 stop:6727 length:285 start_codon:yes stop_codon:yes gene_type:complete